MHKRGNNNKASRLLEAFASLVLIFYLKSDANPLEIKLVLSQN